MADRIATASPAATPCRSSAAEMRKLSSRTSAYVLDAPPVVRQRAAEELVEGFAAKLVETIEDEAPMHRLWYDLRTQSMFEVSLREAVTMIDKTLEEMIWRVVRRYSELSGVPAGRTPAAAYGLLDGIFQQALLGHLTGRAGALADLADQVRELMPFLLEPAAGPAGQDRTRRRLPSGSAR